MSTTAAAAKKQTITEQARGSPATATEEKSFKTEENLSFLKKKKIKTSKGIVQPKMKFCHYCSRCSETVLFFPSMEQIRGMIMELFSTQ